MAEDWKDMLSSLRRNMGPEDDPDGIQAQAEIVETGEYSSQRQPLHVLIDKKGRNGKTATIIEGFTLSQPEIDDIAKKMKQKSGVGGSTRAGEILIQGDHKSEAEKFLRQFFKVK